MIDDLMHGQVVERGAAAPSQGAPREPDEVVVSQTDPIYAQVHLTASRSKRRRFCRSVTAWGAFVDGRRGWVRASDDIISRVCWATVEVLPGGAPWSLWQTILGLWVHVLLFSRPGFCLLYAVFRDLKETGDRGSELIRLSREAQSELLSCVLNVPLFGTDLRAPLAPWVYATDASPWAGAAGRAAVSPGLAAELWRRRQRKGGPAGLEEWGTALARTALGAEPDPWDLAVLVEAGLARVDAPETGLPWVNQYARSQHWQLRRTLRLKSNTHITVQEARVRQALLRSLASDPATVGTRSTVFMDSQAVLGAGAKGRSPSRELNAVLRRSFGDQVLAGVSLGGLHVGTKANPMDAPSRDREIPLPTEDVPAWALAADQEDWPFVDRFLGSGREVFESCGALWPWASDSA
jgi:hypothetical protein